MNAAQSIEPDTRYLRGVLSAEPPPGRSCGLNCTGEVCAYACGEGDGGGGGGGAAAPSATRLYNWEMCGYYPGEDGSLSWQDHGFDGARAS